jgi:hypothetical protein
LLCSLVAMIGRFDVPDVRFQRISSASYAHFCEVSNGILGFREPCTY